MTLKNWGLCYGVAWVISNQFTNLPIHILNSSIITPVGEVLPVPFKITLNMEAFSSCHTVNHPPHLIVSELTLPRCKFARILELLWQTHVMFLTRDERSWMSEWTAVGMVDFLCTLHVYFQKSNSNKNTLMNRTHNASTPKQTFNVRNINR